MHPILKRKWRLFIPLGVVAVVSIGAAAAPAAVPICERAREWVIAHKGTLPTTLPALSTFPLEYRRAIYSELPLETRKTLWHDHLTTYLSPSTELTVEQQAIVREVIGRLDELLASDVASDSLQPRLIAAFGKPLARRVFATLGPEPVQDPEAMTWTASGFVPVAGASAGGLLNLALARVGFGAAPVAGKCECEIGDNYCWTVYCGRDDGCLSSTTGCGTMWGGPCNGSCNNNIEPE